MVTTQRSLEDYPSSPAPLLHNVGDELIGLLDLILSVGTLSTLCMLRTLVADLLLTLSVGTMSTLYKMCTLVAGLRLTLPVGTLSGGTLSTLYTIMARFLPHTLGCLQGGQAGSPHKVAT